MAKQCAAYSCTTNTTPATTEEPVFTIQLLFFGKKSKETQKGPKTRSKKVQNQILNSGPKLGQRTMKKKDPKNVS